MNYPRGAIASSAWTRIKTRIPLAYRVFRVHPMMPATAFWRIYEAEVVLQRLDGEGRGLDLGCGDPVGSPASAAARPASLAATEPERRLAAGHTVSAGRAGNTH